VRVVSSHLYFYTHVRAKEELGELLRSFKTGMKKYPRGNSLKKGSASRTVIKKSARTMDGHIYTLRSLSLALALTHNAHLTQTKRRSLHAQKANEYDVKVLSKQQLCARCKTHLDIINTICFGHTQRTLQFTDQKSI
jgi:hypothetical protein